MTHTIKVLESIKKQLEERKADLLSSCILSGHPACINRLDQVQDDIHIIEEKLKEERFYFDTDSVPCISIKSSDIDIEKLKAVLNSRFGVPVVVDSINNAINQAYKKVGEKEEAKIVSELIASKKLIPLYYDDWCKKAAFKPDEVYCCCEELRDYILKEYILPFPPTFFIINCLPSPDLYVVKDEILKEQFLSILAKKGEAK